MIKTIGLSLFGYKQEFENCHPFLNFLKYLMLNIRAYNSLYSDWDIYLAVDDISYNEFKDIFDFLKDEKIINLEIFPLVELTKMMLWRLKPNSYSDYLICRDIDALPTYREKQAVQLWLNSGLDCHSIHDHIQHHSVNLMGGMIGFKKNIVNLNLLKNSDINFNIKGSDQIFLDRYIYPLVKNSIMEHNIKGNSINKDNPYSYDFIENIKLEMDDNLIESNNMVSYIGQSGLEIPKCLNYWNEYCKKETLNKLIYIEEKNNIFKK